MSDISSDYIWVFWLEDRRVSKVILHVILHKLKFTTSMSQRGNFHRKMYRSLVCSEKKKQYLFLLS
jgi:hypothetical protein